MRNFILTVHYIFIIGVFGMSVQYLYVFTCKICHSYTTLTGVCLRHNSKAKNQCFCSYFNKTHFGDM